MVTRAVTATKVYPRVCGGSLPPVQRGRRGLGLSPRVRGKRSVQRDLRCLLGSIPACAGEASQTSGAAASQKVYPRVCGGSELFAGNLRIGEGLSPRVRGKPARCRALARHLRSIPACAGEAALDFAKVEGDTVYPRVCGGSGRRPMPPSAMTGLSPRVRGKRTEKPHSHPGVGSIPACAGEAYSYKSGVRLGWVYPRVCGGSHQRIGLLLRRRGLSPRVRGKQRTLVAGGKAHRSIPACAGEATSR